MTLLDDLTTANAKAASRRPPCAACAVLKDENDPATFAALRDAFAGSMGVQTLAKVLRANGITTVGRRTIEHHRNEGHTS